MNSDINNNINSNSNNNINNNNINSNNNDINSDINDNNITTTTYNNNSNSEINNSNIIVNRSINSIKCNDTKLNNDNNCNQNISSNSIITEDSNNSQVLKPDVELSEATKEDVTESTVVKETTVKETASSTSPAPLQSYSVNLSVMGRYCSFDYINGPEGVRTVLANAGFNINPKVYVVPLKVKIVEKNFASHVGPEKDGEEEKEKDEQPYTKEVISAKQINKEVNSERPVCTRCGNSFRGRSQLLRHIREVHVGVQRVVCPFCKHGFKRPHDLKRHVELGVCTRGQQQQQQHRQQRQHGQQQKQQEGQQQQRQQYRNLVSVAMDKYVCKDCRVSFKSADYLSYHRCSTDGC